MKFNDFMKEFNAKIKAVGLDDKIKITDTKIRNRIMFRINKDISGSAWLKYNHIRSFVIAIAPRKPTLFMRSYVLYGIAIDLLAQIPIDERNKIMNNLGMTNGQWIDGTSTQYNNISFKASRIADVVLLQIMFDEVEQSGKSAQSEL